MVDEACPGGGRGPTLHAFARSALKSSRETPHGAPLSHHRAHRSRTTAVSDNVLTPAALMARSRSHAVGVYGSSSVSAQAPPFPQRRGAASPARLPSAVPLGSPPPLLPHHTHRMVQAAPWLSNSALRPVLCTNTGSADFPPCSGGCRQPLLQLPRGTKRSPKVRH
jgi:hypothetical protein